MKNKKLFLPLIIILAAVLIMASYSVISSIAKKPTVTEGEFPFTITYELRGETITINDVYKVRYVKNDGYADTKSRVYVGEIGNMGDDNTIYTLERTEGSSRRIELHTQFYPDYLMGDAEYDYFDVFEPVIYFYDDQEQEYVDEETLSEQGVKLISYEYPTPIENSFVFSHISYFSSEVVLPSMLISILALVAIIIFVKKDKDLNYKAIDKISLVLNFVIGFTLVPFVWILASIIDVVGGGPEFCYQALYFIPALSVLVIAASIALRRKGHGVKSLITELAAPVAFAIYLVVCVALDLI